MSDDGVCPFDELRAGNTDALRFGNDLKARRQSLDGLGIRDGQV